MGRNVFYVSRKIVRHLPYRVFKMLTPLSVVVGRIFLKRKKHIVLKNLHLVFGNDKTREEINDMAHSWLKNMCSGMAELTYLIDHPEKIIERVSIEGGQNLEEAVSKGHGVILLSAHFGNFVLMLLRMARAGYKTNCIMRRMKDKQFGKSVYDFCGKNGVRIIYSLPHKECVEQSFKSLRNGQILFVLLDQNYGERGGVFVDFFGKPAATGTGPVIFSNRSGAPILPVFIVGDGVDRHKIIIGEPVKLVASQYEGSSLVRNTAQLTKIIETYIRQYPHEWGGWMHLRWKTEKPVFIK